MALYGVSHMYVCMRNIISYLLLNTMELNNMKTHKQETVCDS